MTEQQSRIRASNFLPAIKQRKYIKQSFAWDNKNSHTKTSVKRTKSMKKAEGKNISFTNTYLDILDRKVTSMNYETQRCSDFSVEDFLTPLLWY